MPNPKIQLDADGEFGSDLPVQPAAGTRAKGTAKNRVSPLPGILQFLKVLIASVGMFFICLFIGGFGFLVLIGQFYYGTTCSSEMALDGGRYRNERIYDVRGRRVCTPIDDEVTSKPVTSPDGEHIALVSNFDWGEGIQGFSSVFVANADGSDLLVIDSLNDVTDRRSVWYVNWVNDQTVALEYPYEAFVCYYHIDGTFIGCE